MILVALVQYPAFPGLLIAIVSGNFTLQTTTMKQLFLSLLLISTFYCEAQTEDYYGPVKISFHGFICNRPTNDDPLGGDGVSDEVTPDFWVWSPITNNRAAYAGMQRIYGEDFLLPNRIKAGSATINGGIKAGDSYYRENLYDDDNFNSLGKYDIVNTFCSNSTLVAIFPALFERDEGPLHSSPFQALYTKVRQAFADGDIQSAIQDFSLNYTYNDGNPYGFFLAGRYIGLDARFVGMFSPNKNKLASRPIGLFANWDYSSQLIVLTPKTIKIIAEKDYGYGKGILPVMFNEESMGNTEGHGNYIVLLRIKADIKDRNAGQTATTRSVTIKVQNAGAGESFKFRINAQAGWDTVLITNPNTTATFSRRVSQGQQYQITQMSGRTCQLSSYTGVAGTTDIIITANCAGTGAGTRKLGVSYASSLMSVKDRFELQLNNGEKIVIDNDHKLAYFSKLFNPGESYRIRQVSGARACNFTTSTTPDSIAQGIMGNEDLVVSLNCVAPSLSIIKMNIIGIESNERFNFSDNYGRSWNIPGSRLVQLGGFPVGDPLFIKQAGNPRNCVITAPAVVPNSPLTIECDCGKDPGSTPATTAKLKGTFSSPAGTKIVLQLNNSDELVLTQTTGTGNWQTMNFSFPKSYPAGTAYTAMIKSPNPGCIIYENAEGRIADSTIIRIRCDKGIDLVSRSSDNKILGTYYESFNPVIGGKNEDEGRYVAFGSSAKGLDGSTGKYRQLFWRDRKLGITKMISRNASGEEGNGNSQMAAISADGKTVAFESYATNLVSGDNSWTRDVYAWNEQTNIVELISKTPGGMAGNGESYEPVISGDGTVIAYTSNASDIVPLGPVYSTPNVYVNSGGSNTFITKDYETGKAVTGYAPSISEDGSKVVFCAYNNRLVENDNNNLWDIFLWQSGMQKLKRISFTASGAERNQGSESASRVVWPNISGDGNWVVYATTASNMVNGDNNAMQDIFICNSSGGGVKRISEGKQAEGNGDSPISQGERIGISYDGSWVSYNTNADNLGVPKGNIVLQNTRTLETVPVTKFTNGSSARPMISRSGAYVIAGCSEKYDPRFPSSGIFVFYPRNY